MKSIMFFPTGKEEKEGVISTSAPVEYKGNKKIILTRLFTSEDNYDEIYEFIRDQNQTSSGNFTLFPKSEIERFKRLNTLGVLMRSLNGKLVGTVFSVPLPVRCHFTDTTEVVAHGCTTFLNVHEKLRGHGMCMALIRELSHYGYQNNHICSYFLTDFQLCPNSVKVNSWYRPLDLPKSIGLGFGFPDWNAPSKFHENRIKFACKLPKGWKCVRVVNNKALKALKFYRQVAEEKRLAWWPNEEQFTRWIQEYPTFLCSKDGTHLGLFSIATIFARMETGLDGELSLPLVFIVKNSDDSDDNNSNNNSKDVLNCLIWASKDRSLEVLYLHQVGDLTGEVLSETNCIQNDRLSYFSFYNNSMKVSTSDIYVPLF